VAVIGASTGIFGAVWAQAELRKSLRYAGAHVLDEELAVGGADQALGSDGRLRDPELDRGLKQVVAALDTRSPARCGRWPEPSRRRRFRRLRL